MSPTDIFIIIAFALAAVAVIVWNGVKHHKAKNAPKLSSIEYIKKYLSKKSK